MKPILFRIFDFGVPSYSVMMTVGYLMALGALWALARRHDPAGGSGLSFSQMFDLWIVMVVSSLLGSKAAHVLFEAAGHVDEDGKPIGGLIELLKSDPLHWARLGEGGFVWYGGLIAALGTAIFYFRHRPWLNGWMYTDAFTPAIVLGLAFGRFGCFLAGCCYGVPTESTFGVKFPQLPTPVHPTQLYEAVVALLLFAFLWWRFPRRRFDGESIAYLLVLYAIPRSMIEVLRGDADRGAVGGVSTSQLISIPLFLIGLWIFWRGRLRDP
ncbi:MAG: prolipoprotein diacylglyceryl transferase [Deltaproteobacteria bacterium]|nr:prolipoprotein diacylglyceryl transferase [Deltaproteobacteria bacterium]